MLQSTPSSPATSTPPLSTKTILLVDDDSSIRAIFRTTLERHGFTVLPAKNADEALEICSHYRNSIDLLLADLMLPPKVRLARDRKLQPTIHGLELTRRISAMRRDVRIILFSGQPDDTIRALGNIPDGVPFLRKPFSLDTLVRTVGQTLA